MQNAQSFTTAKMVRFEIGADGQEIGAPLAELMQWRMRPRRAGCFHGGESDRLAQKWEGARA